jgi:hypothetical protein
LALAQLGAALLAVLVEPADENAAFALTSNIRPHHGAVHLGTILAEHQFLLWLLEYVAQKPRPWGYR